MPKLAEILQNFTYNISANYINKDHLFLFRSFLFLEITVINKDTEVKKNETVER